MNANELTNLKPYSILRKNNNGQLAVIGYNNQGIITVPIKSASKFVELLNDAFYKGAILSFRKSSIDNNGVSVLNMDISTSKSKPMPVEELHPIYKKNSK